jgi:hypothetical protein
VVRKNEEGVARCCISALIERPFTSIGRPLLLANPFSDECDSSTPFYTRAGTDARKIMISPNSFERQEMCRE